MHVRALFELLNVAKENACELRRLADGATKHGCLFSGVKIRYTSREWQNSQTGCSITFQQLLDFLNHRCQTLEAMEGRNTNVSTVHDLMLHL